MASVEDLMDAALAADRGALARLLSLAERGGAAAGQIEERIAKISGQAFVVGITGPPGAGKSTLISALLPVAREAVGRVAVLAVDPSSPFSRGALLGDRIRMQGREFGADVFIRSMASRGEVGGLAGAASTCAGLFDACGWPLVVIETLGIGQVELDIMDLADTVVVVLNPGWGDEIQANKAGLTEAGDIFVINKADKPGAAQTRQDLLDSLSLLHRAEPPPILETVATTADGLKELWQALALERQRLDDDGQRAERHASRRRRALGKSLRRRLEGRLDSLMASDEAKRLLELAARGDLDLESVIDRLIATLAGNSPPSSSDSS